MAAIPPQKKQGDAPDVLSRHPLGSREIIEMKAFYTFYGHNRCGLGGKLTEIEKKKRRSGSQKMNRRGGMKKENLSPDYPE